MRRNMAAKMTRSVEITKVAVYRQMPLQGKVEV
jgi:hypothetical protein